MRKVESERKWRTCLDGAARQAGQAQLGGQPVDVYRYLSTCTPAAVAWAHLGG